MTTGIREGKTFVEVNYQPKLDVDLLHLQKSLGNGSSAETSSDFYAIEARIKKLRCGHLVSDRLNSKSVTKRSAWIAEKTIEIEMAQAELNSTKAERLEKIAVLQKRQQELIEQRRKENAAYLISTKAAAQATRDAERASLEHGEFWNCSEDTLKKFFDVPFAKRKLVDISERFRAALFVEVAYDAWGRNGETGLQPTDHAYLCGIDDNGEQWGFRVIIEQRERDDDPERDDNPYKETWSYSSTVEYAMATAWGITIDRILDKRTLRQGEVLFLASDKTHDDAEEVNEIAVAPSHTARGGMLVKRLRRGVWVKAIEDVVVEHPTHAAVTLQAGTTWWALAHVYDSD